MLVVAVIFTVFVFVLLRRSGSNMAGSLSWIGEPATDNNVGEAGSLSWIGEPATDNNVGEVIMNSLPRGIRNNNPLNIKYNSANNWVGQAGSDGVFCVFTDAKYGIRAAAKLINNYRNKYGLKTVRQIVSRWAPAGVENPHQSNYIAHCAKWIGISPDDELSANMYPHLIAAMIKFENGQQPYSIESIRYGVSLA